MIWNLLQKRREYHLGFNETLLYRVWSAASSSIMQGLACDKMLVPPASVDDFLVEYKFDSLTDEENRGSDITPLMLACASGNVRVVNELTTRYLVNVNARTRIKIPEVGAARGGTALHFSGFCPRDQSLAVITALLSAGAKPNAGTAEGIPPLMAAASLLNSEAVACILNVYAEKDGLDIEKTLPMNSASVLNVACYQSTAVIVELLLDAGADRAHRNANGGSPLLDACSNPAAGTRMLELIFTPTAADTSGLSTVDINYQTQPRTPKWIALNVWFRSILRCGVSRSELVMEMAHTEGATVSQSCA